MGDGAMKAISFAPREEGRAGKWQELRQQLAVAMGGERSGRRMHCHGRQGGNMAGDSA